MIPVPHTDCVPVVVFAVSRLATACMLKTRRRRVSRGTPFRPTMIATPMRGGLSMPRALALLATCIVSFAATVLWGQPVTQGRLLGMHPPRPASHIFADLPPPIHMAMLRLPSVEEMFSDGSRRALSLDEVTAIYQSGGAGGLGPRALPPIIFLINLDQRVDRLDNAVQKWVAPHIARVLRVSAKPSLGSINGASLAHLSIIFAMEEHGWPFVVVLEDDAEPRQPQWNALFPRVVSHVEDRQGDVGWVHFSPSRLDASIEKEVNGLLYSVGGMQSMVAGLYGRRMIAAAHEYLPKLVSQKVANRDDAALDYAFGRTRIGLPRPNDLCTVVESALRKCALLPLCLQVLLSASVDCRTSGSLDVVFRSRGQGDELRRRVR